jgi:flagellar motility protein MotE (MotC chaperone)
MAGQSRAFRHTGRRAGSADADANATGPGRGTAGITTGTDAADPRADADGPGSAACCGPRRSSSRRHNPALRRARGHPPSVQSLADKDPTTFTRAEIDLLANLAQRRDQIEQRAREIDLRESLLAAAEKRLDERIAEIKKLEASVKQIVQQYDKQEEQNLQGLVKVYENMKPKDAARIFEKLEPNVLLGVVERMKEAKLAALLAEMAPQTAQDLTVRLATRKQIPPSVRAGVESQLQAPAATAPAGGAQRVPVTPRANPSPSPQPAPHQPSARLPAADNTVNQRLTPYYI